MKFEIVSGIPEKKWDKPTRKSIKPMLRDFMNSEADTAHVTTEPFEYSSSESLAETLNQSANRAGYPIKVIKRGSDVYIRKENK